MSTRHPLKDIQFIADFAAFCRTKGDKGYDAWNQANCALAQYGYKGANSTCLVRLGIPREAYLVAVLVQDEDCRFDLLADRLEALLVDAPEIEVVK